MRRMLLTLAAIVMLSGSAFGQIDLIGYSFENIAGGGTTAPTFFNSGLISAPTNMSNVGGTSALVTGGQASFLPFFPNSQNNSYRITNFSNGTTHFTFSFTVGAFPINLTTYSFDATTDGSTVAPTAWQLKVNGVQADAGTTANNVLDGTPAVPLYAGTFSGFTGLTGVVTVDLFATTGNATGSWRLDNFTIAAVPEPATFALLGVTGVAIGAGAWYRRRRLAKADKFSPRRA